MLNRIPNEICKYLTEFLTVRDCLNLEISIHTKIYCKRHYQSKLYKEDYVHEYSIADKKLFVQSCSTKMGLFSIVNPYDQRQFLIRHTEDISTREANKKAYKVIEEKRKTILKRRLEMIGFE